MGFISENLLKDETVAYQARLHWVIYMPAGVCGIFFLISFAAPFLLGIFFIATLWFGVSAYVRQTTTEIAVTNKRLLGKTGFIKRDTIDLNLKKVESLYADQGLFGRMFDYGAVRIVGTGGSSFMVKGVLDPVAFKRAANEQIDAAQA